MQGKGPNTPPNRYAQASLLFAVISYAFYFLPFAPASNLASVPCAILAIILGHVARAQVRHHGLGGPGLARVGLLLGYAAIVLAVLSGPCEPYITGFCVYFQR